MTTESLDEPIPRLSPEEYELLTQSILKSRKPPRIQAIVNKILESEITAGEEGLEIGAKVWQLRKKGWSRTEIRKELGIPQTVLDNCLREFELRMGLEAGRMMEHYRLLDDERIEDLMRYWLPIACEGKIRIEHMRSNGETYTELDFDRPLKAAFWVLAAVNQRLKLMMAARPEGARESQTNVLVWLQNVMPGIQKVVQNVEAPREVLILETEAEKNYDATR